MTPRLCSTALVLALCATVVSTQGAETPETTLTGVSANVAQPGQPVQIRIFRWSSERERTPILVAMDPLPPPAADAERGGARAGRAGAARGRGRGGRAAAPAAPLTPEVALAGAIRRAPSLGYIWTNDVTGYSIKYAQRMPLPDGGERIVLAVDRRFGEHAAAWQLAWTPPAGDASAKAAQTDYPFTVIEMRLDAKGTGEAKTSLTSKVFVDKASGTLALENYAEAPVILQKVRRTAAPSRPPS